RMPVLIALSLVFYGYWDVRFVPLLVLSILINWFGAKYYVATKQGSIITAAIAANLVALGAFKYTNFFAETAISLGFPVGPFAIGLIEKTLLAVPIAHVVDPVYGQAKLGPVPHGDSWLALGFMFQILFDFAGYSDIAIGVALLFGVKLPYNFDAPFRSSSLQDFWQRWHMTLLTFLRDYLFHPLANARFGRGHRLLQYFGAMILTMALCGLWHGPSWTYVLWGVIHGTALVMVSLWRRYGWP